jgi:HSP20 family protein
MLGDLMSIEGTLWDEFERLRRDIDALFSPGLGLASIRAVARGSFPPLNVGATPEAVHVYLFAPGLDMNQVDVSIQRNLLTISGERKITAPEATGEGGYHLRERFTGSFRRVVSLPDDVNPDQVNAVYRNGVLSVTVAKQAVAKPRQIEVKSA